MFFGAAVLPLTYILSFYFTEPATGFARVTLLNLFTGKLCYDPHCSINMSEFNQFTGMSLYITVRILYIELIDCKKYGDLLSIVFRVFPHFSMASAFNNIFMNSAVQNACGMTLLGALPDGLRCQLMPKCCGKQLCDF